MSSRQESPGPGLHGAEGELVSVRILVEPRTLERALEALAGLNFPINPQIFHDLVRKRATADGAESAEAAAAIEFPAWSERLAEVREALGAPGLDAATVSIGSMWSAVRRGPEGAERALQQTA